MADPKLKRPDDLGMDAVNPGFRAGAALRKGAGTAYSSQAKGSMYGSGAGIRDLAKVGTGFVAGLFGGSADNYRESTGGGGGAGAQDAAPRARLSAPAAANPAAPPTPKPPTLPPEVQVRPGAEARAAMLRPGDPNTFTGSNGVTRGVDDIQGVAQPPATPTPTLQAPPPVVARPSNAPAVQASTQRVVSGQRDATLDTRADAARLLNPMSNEAGLMRRAEIASRTMRGSPSARAAVVNALLGQIGAQNDASAAGQDTANEALLQGAAGEGFADEAAARRRLDADQFNVDAGQRGAELAADQRRPTGATLRGLDGVTSVLRNDGTATPIVGPDGQPILTPTPAPAGQITPRDLLESYNTQAQAIAESLATPQEKQAQMQALRQDPTYAPIFGGQQQAGPPKTAAEFIERARAAGRTESNEALTAYFNQQQGN